MYFTLLNELFLLWKQLVIKVTACQLIFNIFLDIHFGVIYIWDLLQKLPVLLEKLTLFISSYLQMVTDCNSEGCQAIISYKAHMMQVTLSVSNDTDLTENTKKGKCLILINEMRKKSDFSFLFLQSKNTHKKCLAL